MTIRTGSFTYPSSIDPTITNLFAFWAYDDAYTDMPIVANMHGYRGEAPTVADNQTNIMIAGSHAFIVYPGMRGRNGASGSQDSGAREIHDIIDAVEYVRSHFSSVVSQTRVAMFGTSGGGGNAMSLACKFPDYFTNITAVYGMSDYGVWLTNEYTAFGRALGQSWVGGSLAEVPEKYAARNSQTAITNYTGGRLYLVADTGDQLVAVHQTTDVVAILNAAGHTNFESYITSKEPVPLPGSESHAPYADEEVDDYWGDDVTARAQAPWTVPESGTLNVIGYLVTKRFSVWLGDGTEHRATVEYGNGAYTVTPSATCDVTLKVNGTSQTQTVTTAGYTFTNYAHAFDIRLLADAPAPAHAFDVRLLADVEAATFDAGGTATASATASGSATVYAVADQLDAGGTVSASAAASGGALIAWEAPIVDVPFDWTASGRSDEFEFVRVSRTGSELEKLTTVTGGSIDEDLNTALKSSGSLSIVGDFDIRDDRVRVYLVSTMAGKSMRVALGTFFATTPQRNVDAPVSTAKVELMSVLLQLDEDAVETTFVIPAGTVAVAYAQALAEGSGLAVVSTPSTAATTTPATFEAGTSLLKIINHLLDFAGYASAVPDGYGRVVMAPYRNPSERVPVWTFRDDDQSILLPGTTDEVDWYHTPNVCIATMSNPDATMTVVAVNDDPQSAYSTVSRGRRIVRTEDYTDIAGLEALQAKADALLVSSSSNVQSVSIKHNFVPFAVGDVIRLDYQAKAIDYSLTAQARKLQLVPGVPVTTSARRFVRG